MNKLSKTVNKEDIYIEFLKSLNGILQMTERELELMAILIKLDVETPERAGFTKNVISTENRKYINRTLGITYDNLSRYIAKFKRDGFIIKGKADDHVYVNKALIPDVIRDRVQITIVLKMKEDDN